MGTGFSSAFTGHYGKGARMIDHERAPAVRTDQAHKGQQFARSFFIPLTSLDEGRQVRVIRFALERVLDH